MTEAGAAEKDTASLLAAAQAGDRSALERLLARYQGHILRFGLKMCRHPEDARDVVQETLVAAARSIEQFRGEASLSTWLYRIARSFCAKKRRRRELGSPTDRSEELEQATDAVAESPEEQVGTRQLVEALYAALDQLDPKYREVFLLRDVEGLSAAQTASVLGLQVATVKTRLHRARLQVRAALAPVLGRSERQHGCPEIARVFSRHLEGDLSPQLCAKMERHLRQCKSCRNECESLRFLLAACRELPGTEVPEDLDRAVRTAIREVA